MTSVGPREEGPSRDRVGPLPSAAPSGAKPAMSLRTAVLNPGYWRERLREYSRATGLTVALIDEHGRLLGRYTHPRSGQGPSSSLDSTAVTGCLFSPASSRPCSCVWDALVDGRTVVRDRPGPGHFAVALSLDEHPIGILLAGQNPGPTPQTRPEASAGKMPVSPLDGAHEPGPQQYSPGRSLLRVQADLLKALGQTLLEAHYRAFREVERLDEMTRLRDRAMAEIADRRRVEERQRFVLEASAEFDSRDDEATVKRLARRSVPFLADLCFVDVGASEEAIPHVSWMHAVPAQQARFDRFDPPGDGQYHPLARALREGRAEFVPEVTDAWMRTVATSPRHLEIMRDMDIRSLIAVPITTSERNLGMFTFCYTGISGRQYTEDDLHLAEDLGGRVATVVENARLYQSLQKADRLKNEFLAVLGHELRGPLAPILSAIQFLRAKGPADPEIRWAAGVIERQSQQLARLVDDVLDIFRIGQGKLHLRRGLVDLADVVAQAVESGRPLMDAKGLRLEISLPESEAVVNGDLARLVQVTANLLNNSAKYTEAGGRIEVVVEANNHQAILRVRDTGIGIASEMLPSIFDLFVQIPDLKDRSAGGLGIGLSLVRGLIEQHGGSVQATSAGLGMGSEFVVRLPLQSATN